MTSAMNEKMNTVLEDIIIMKDDMLEMKENITKMSEKLDQVLTRRSKNAQKKSIPQMGAIVDGNLFTIGETDNVAYMCITDADDSSTAQIIQLTLKQLLRLIKKYDAADDGDEIELKNARFVKQPAKNVAGCWVKPDKMTLIN